MSITSVPNAAGGFDITVEKTEILRLVGIRPRFVDAANATKALAAAEDAIKFLENGVILPDGTVITEPMGNLKLLSEDAKSGIKSIVAAAALAIYENP